MANATMIDETGKRYGKWLVIGLGSPMPDGRNRWLCKCDCGATGNRLGNDLRSGHSKSCGCGRAELNRMPNGGAALNERYSAYRRQAESKGRSFALTKDEFREITSEPCHYCGTPPSNTATGSVSKAGFCSEYQYNGIDRIENDAGYIPGNVVPCCKRCNVAKNNMSFDEFISWGRQLAARLFAKG